MEILPYLQSLESPDQPLSITYIQPDLHPNLTANNTSNFADRNVCATNMNVLFFFFFFVIGPLFPFRCFKLLSFSPDIFFMSEFYCETVKISAHLFEVKNSLC